MCSNNLQHIEVREMGPWLEGKERLPFLNTGTTFVDFQSHGTVPMSSD